MTRISGLYNAGVVSKQDLDQARTALETAKSQLQALDASVREQQVQLHYYSVIAPWSGIVGDIPVRVGDRVTTTTTLTTVDQPGTLEVYVYVPIERASQLKMNLPVQVLDASGNVIADSRVSFISPQVDNTTQTILVKASVANNKDKLRQSQFIRARVVWGTQKQSRRAGARRLPHRRTVFRLRRRTERQRRVRSPSEAAEGRRDRRQQLCCTRWNQARRKGDRLRNPVPDRRHPGHTAGLVKAFVECAADFTTRHRGKGSDPGFSVTLCLGTLCLWGEKIADDARHDGLIPCSLTSSFTAQSSPPSARCSSFWRALSSFPRLPIAQFPNLAPPQVSVSSFYIGASAQTVESAVTTPLEQQINGAEG